MNKLLVSDSIKLNNGSYVIECLNNNLDITIDGNVTIYIINELVKEMKIYLNNKSNLNIYMFNKNINSNLEVYIEQNNNSKIYYNQSYLNNQNNKVVINNKIKGNNNEAKINVRNISNSGLSEIIINMEILKDTKDNIAYEDLKGITNGGLVSIEPNIIALSNEVEANHLTTIGSLDKNVLDYLMSKGINLLECKKILLKGFISSNMDKYIKEVWGDIYA